MIKKLVASAFILGAALAGLPLTANADPITCPPGQAATQNPSGGGWVCINQGGNANNSEDPRSPNKDKGDFRH